MIPRLVTTCIRFKIAVHSFHFKLWKNGGSVRTQEGGMRDEGMNSLVTSDSMR